MIPICRLSLLLLVAPVLHAEDLRFANLFDDGMVLQRDLPLRIWGWAEPGAAVSVGLGQAGGQVEVLDVPFADDTGLWVAHLGPMAASFEPRRLVAHSGDATVEVADVLVGEVWLTSGQSNMEWGATGDAEWMMERACADYPAVRYCDFQHVLDEPPDDLPARARWRSFAAGQVGNPSGFSYFFAVRLHRYLRVPVGIVNNSVGGTLAEQWTSRARLESLPALGEYLASSAPRSNCYNGMIAPIARLALRGACFFQGENNSIGKWNVYAHSFPAMIDDWRATFGRPDLPFGIVSLYGFGPHEEDLEPELTSLPPGLFWYAAIRDVQHEVARRDPHAGLIVTTDLGDTENIHPHRKREVGERAARWALAEVYGQTLLYTGPRFREARVADGKLLCAFDMDPHLRTVMNRKDGDEDRPVWWQDWPISREGRRYRGFVIAGADRVFHPAEVRRAQGPGVLEVWSPLVPEPVAVRYGWSGMPFSNVIGHEHLPLHPFRSDDWTLLDDPPYSGEDQAGKQAWDARVNELREEARRAAARRELAEARLLVQRLEREAAKYVVEAGRDAWRERARQVRQGLGALEAALSD